METPSWLARKIDRASKGTSRKKARRAIEAAKKHGIYLWYWKTAIEDFQLPSMFGTPNKKKRKFPRR